MHNPTGFSLTGFRVTQEPGTVRGIVVRSRSRSDAGNIGAIIQPLFGGDFTLRTELGKHAATLGANAILGLRYDAPELSPGVTEVLCYGTAVVAAPA